MRAGETTGKLDEEREDLERWNELGGKLRAKSPELYRRCRELFTAVATAVATVAGGRPR